MDAMSNAGSRGWMLAGLMLVGVSSSGWGGASVASALTAREAQVFQQICAECHTQPGIGVPVVGDETEWQARRAKGLDQLLANTVDGWLGMPPLGTCSFCSEEELRHLVIFLAGMPSEPGP